MYRILDNLYVGKANFAKIARDAGFSILGACKYPLHQENARLMGHDKPGYLKIPQNEPEYLYAYRDHSLYLNLIDGDDWRWIADNMIDVAIQFIHSETSAGHKVFIACNSAESRSPSIAFMYMIDCGLFDECNSFEEAYKGFQRMYPFYAPQKGIADYTKNYFEKRRVKDGERE